MRRSLPVLRRPSRRLWASVAADSGYSRSIRTFSMPDPTMSNTSFERPSNSSRVSVWCTRDGRVTNNDPPEFNRCRSRGPTAPLACPNSANVPRGRRQARLLSKVDFPTES